MRTRKSQILLLLPVFLFCGIFFSNIEVSIAATPPPPTKDQPVTKTEPKTEPQAPAAAWDKAANEISGSQARLGNELMTLPGPNISFQDLLKLIITWSAQLAASVAILITIWTSFKGISGTEESHNEMKRVIIKVVISLTLIFFSYQLIAFIMGIIWAGS